MEIRATTLAFAISAMVLLATLLSAAQKNERRLEDAVTVLSEIMTASDKTIPQSLLEKAHCVVVIPGLKKGAFLFGARYGKGYISCRPASGLGWSAPATDRAEGGSFGLQIGVAETDLVMLVMNESGAAKVMQSKFTDGGTAQAAAGPVGRPATAETDGQMRAEILSYSRARGLFAGAALQGGTLRADLDASDVWSAAKDEGDRRRSENQTDARREWTDRPADQVLHARGQVTIKV